MISTLIVDDQNIIRQGIKVLLENSTEIELIGFAEDGASAIKSVEATQPDVILLDINLPDIDGLTVAEQIGTRFPQIKIIMLSGSEDKSYVRRAMASNAKGYLLKNVSAEELEWSIKLAHQGYSAFKSELLESIGEESQDTAKVRKTQVERPQTPILHNVENTTPAAPVARQRSQELERLVAKNQLKAKYLAMKSQHRSLAFHNVNISRAKKTMMSFEFKLLVFIILFSLGFLVFVALL
ncbi:MAG: response regulator transcription factor [Cyanobacteria bacterium J06600_6]